MTSPADIVLQAMHGISQSHLTPTYWIQVDDFVPLPNKNMRLAGHSLCWLL
jgi:hypothetical protein